MARQKKYEVKKFDEDDPGDLTYHLRDLYGKMNGEISDSGDLYLGKDLAGLTTITIIPRTPDNVKIIENAMKKTKRKPTTMPKNELKKDGEIQRKTDD